MKTFLNSMAIVASATALILTGCDRASSSEIGAKNAEAVVEVVKPCPNCGTIKSITAVKIRPAGTGMGAALGAIVGGLAGHSVGGGTGKGLATVAGAVGGGVVGNNLERNSNEHYKYKIGVTLENGNFTNVTVADATGYAIGEPVIVEGGTLRSR